MAAGAGSGHQGLHSLSCWFGASPAIALRHGYTVLTPPGEISTRIDTHARACACVRSCLVLSCHTHKHIHTHERTCTHARAHTHPCTCAGDLEHIKVWVCEDDMLNDDPATAIRRTQYRCACRGVM